MVISAASPLSLGSSCQLCHADGFYCSTSYGVTSTWIKSPIESQKAPDYSRIRCRNPHLGAAQFHWLTVGHNRCLWKVSVAADYSDSVPDSSSYAGHRSYHPLEDVKVNKRMRDTQLTAAEITRTTVEANNSALLVFPGTVHSEPHEQISWAEFPYVVDDYGDIFFEIFDDKNMLQDPGATNPVNVLIGMDIAMYENRRIANDDNAFDIGSTDDIPFDDDYFELMDSEVADVPVDWGMPGTSSWVHPIYFAKCMTKSLKMLYAEHRNVEGEQMSTPASVNIMELANAYCCYSNYKSLDARTNLISSFLLATDMECDRKMDHPSNGVSILGCLRPAFADEESYLRRLFRGEDGDDYNSSWRDVEILSFSPKTDESNTGSTLYRLEIMRIELFSVYGIQSAIGLQDFQDAEPDVLAHSTSAILEHFNEKGIRCNAALKALCKKKGLHVEGANLIGVDSLGIDVRIFSGVEARTHRFPFKVRVTCEAAAEKQIHQLLFPPSRRKKFKTHDDRLGDSKSF